jgi:TRAP-type uncharacterized transport system substrate-binding protein
VVKQFVEAIQKNKKDLVAGHPNFNLFDPAGAGKVQPRLQYHPAAIQYFKEAGIWKG